LLPHGLLSCDELTLSPVAMPFVATNIDYSSLEVKEKIAEGNFAIVHRALWKGTEVAVKVSTLDWE
jgi:hypothetical protein